MVYQHTQPIENSNSLWYAFDALLSWVFGIVLLFAAIPHLENSYHFLGSVYAYKLVDPGIGQMVAMILPLMQLTIAVLLIGRIFVDTANFIVVILFGVFATVQSLAYFSDLGISCGCFGPEHDSPIGWSSLSLVYGLLTLSVIRNAIFLFSRNPKQLPCQTHQTTDASSEQSS